MCNYREWACCCPLRRARRSDAVRVLELSEIKPGCASAEPGVPRSWRGPLGTVAHSLQLPVYERPYMAGCGHPQKAGTHPSTGREWMANRVFQRHESMGWSQWREKARKEMGKGEGGVGGNPKPSSGSLSTNIDLYVDGASARPESSSTTNCDVTRGEVTADARSERRRRRRRRPGKRRRSESASMRAGGGGHLSSPKRRYVRGYEPTRRMGCRESCRLSPSRPPTLEPRLGMLDHRSGVWTRVCESSGAAVRFA